MSARQKVLAQIEASRATKRAELTAATGALDGALADARALFERQTNPHHHFLRDAAQVKADVAHRVLAEFEATCTPPGDAQLDAFAAASAAADRGAFLESVAPEVAGIVDAEAVLRAQVDSIARKAAAQNAAAREATRLAEALGLEPPPGHGGVHFEIVSIQDARQQVALRLRELYPTRVLPLEDWVRP